MESPWHQQPAQRHYPRDGYDFRAPVMSAQNGSNMDWTHNEQNTIDLTGDRHDHSPPHMRIALPYAPGGGLPEASGPSSRTQRGPRYDRNIINLEGSDDEDHAERQMRDNRIPGQSIAPDEESLFLPDTTNDYSPFTQGPQRGPPSNDYSPFTAPTHRRPTTSGLRPGYMRQNPPAVGLDDVQVVASRSISRHPSRRSTPSLHRPNETGNNTGSATIDLTADDDDDDDDDVIHTSTRTLPGINGDRPAMAGSGVGTRERPVFGIAHLAQAMRARGGSPGVFDRFPGLDVDRDDPAARARAHQRLTRYHADAARLRREDLEMQHERARAMARLHEATRRNEHEQFQQLLGAALPAARATRGPPRVHVQLDFGLAAFDLGMNGPARPATPKYEAPPRPENGFTRSPEEDEEVVCPNCGDELAVSDDETKAQVWVVKACGHVSSPSSVFL